jgi:hypothetical protein
MKLAALSASAFVALATLAGPGAAIAATPHTATAHVMIADRHHRCTHTSSGSCIRGGEFCPQADYGHSGWDAKGRRYVCKGNHTHPHWMKP